MSDKDKAVVDKTEDYESRYKDSQAHISKIEAENAEYRALSQKDKDLLDAVTPYVDWAAVNGTKTVNATSDDDDALVDRKTLAITIEDLRSQINSSNITNSFRIKHPDMIEYEELVGVYLKKTDSRRPMEERLDMAVESTRKLLDSERKKGRELSEKEKKEKVAKEAEASGLGKATSQKGTEKEPDGESYEEYVKGRLARQGNAMGV